MVRFFAGAVAVPLLFASTAAFAVTPLVSTVTLQLGGPPVHLTPRGYDINGVEVPVTIGPTGQCTIVGVPSTLATVSYDSTGAVFNAVAIGSVTTAKWVCVSGGSSGGITVNSLFFTVTVPWNVTQVGDTSP